MKETYSKLLDYLKKRNIKNVLLIAFEDSEIIKLIQNKFNFNLKILSKSDFVGSYLSTISKKIREKRYDLVIISNVNSQVNRSRTSLKTLALISKSKNQIILFDEEDIAATNKFGLFFDLFPKLLVGLVYAIVILIKTYFSFYVYYPLVIKKKSKFKTDNKTILFLRTDLAGKIFAGGSVTHIKGFINGAKQLGFDTIYAGDFPLIDHHLSILIKPNLLLDFFDEFQLMDYHFRVIKKLKKCFNGNNIGLIYQRHSIFNASGVILSYYLNVPLILEVNNSEVWAKKNWSRLVFERLANKIEKFALKNADVIGVVSEVTKAQIKHLCNDENKIVINPNGVDPIKFSSEIDGNQIRKELNLENFFVVGFIGTFTRWHGVETLFDAAVKVIEKNGRIKFLLIGDGNLKANLELKTHQLGLDDKIIFTGLIPHDKAPEYLAACDVLVSPHLGFEDGTRFFGSPTKLFEYMAMGKPIIASDLEQIGKIIIDGENGLKFKPGDVEKLTELILKLYDDEFLRTKLGKKAREDVIKNYTWKQNAYRVLSKVFDQLSTS
ncbi:MAG: glycosyltransferase family 4 protein [Ignavibacteria bacterium]|jgi:glycosyltransferase involved in cell wall biosynthesis|nr:glycosyltransferase family 4 protein [Ignavibacteria bacterium]MDH7527896.1 glycosyltransferase family 4 protein [Ignavibacteria bacterium]